MENADRAFLVQLRETLTQRFNPSELQNLCFDLGVSYHDLAGDAHGDKARELVLLCMRQKRVAELVTHAMRVRPDVAWDMAPASPAPRQPAADPELLRTRRDVYEQLYRILKPFARYDTPEPLATEVLGRITTAMRDWYFDVGGLYLTDNAREPYFALKEAIKVVSEQPRDRAAANVSADDAATLLRAASVLRAALRADLDRS